MQSATPLQIPTFSTARSGLLQAPPAHSGTLQAPPAKSTNTSSPQEAKEPPTHACVICCDSLPEVDMKQPCRFCKEWFCDECIADMFDRAIDTPTAMPPKCHMIFQLHTGLPLLSTERAQMFRDKFEEWLATDKVYCPVKTCATFIPERIYHPVIACPTCCIGICLECRQTAHAGKPCDTTVKDHEMAMMAQYGYKQCPVCRTAVKRMFGCSHM
ncbi:hypothetical protein BDZ85DRAFT_191777, partial [Elsinoe ampelina]